MVSMLRSGRIFLNIIVSHRPNAFIDATLQSPGLTLMLTSRSLLFEWRIKFLPVPPTPA